MRFQDVSDGLSNTMAFSETVQGHSKDLRGFAWWNGGAHFETHLGPNSSQPDILENISYCIPPSTDVYNPPCDGPTTANPENIAARSRHPNGVMTCLCDGSVRFIPNSINLDTWRAISTAGGREVAGDF
jgi:prepilin-type processing-associated H-X9-DG protein